MNKAFYISLWLHVGLLCSVGCAVHKQVPGSDVRVSMLLHFKFVSDQLPLYIKDDLSRYEQPEIQAVVRDIYYITKGTGEVGVREIDPVDYERLMSDWDTLVVLDRNLQVRHLT